ncbi:MAG: hypothetical protein IJ811_04925 [Clostridia bacterium]|nr:hypothetical protein [Clostridia bacterium]
MQCRYAYDAWGNHKIYDGSGVEVLPADSNIGNVNPFRYRGYYWDSEFGWYYLKTRYYYSALFLRRPKKITNVGLSNVSDQNDNEKSVDSLSFFPFVKRLDRF